MATRAMTPHGEKISAVLYTRVSTGKQAASGLGLEAQLAACRELAARKGYQVVGEYTDSAISGRDAIDRRPGLQAVIAAAARREDVVVIAYSLSRLARRQSLVWALLDERGEYRLRLESASEPFDTSSPMGRAMLGMLAIFAQLEADMCSERTSAALEARRARGLRLGPPPMAEVNPELAARVRELYASGDFTHASLAVRLNEDGVAAPRGGKWHATTIARVLRTAA